MAKHSEIDHSDLVAEGLVVPWAVVPDVGATSAATLAFASNNQAVIVPVTILTEVEISGVHYTVGTASGNVSFALYSASYARLATSGSVACPASGAATTSFTAAYTAAPGRYWLGMSCSTTAATFQHCNISGQNTLLAKTAATHHPLPDPFVPASSVSRAPSMVGLITGGWAA